MKNKHKEAIKEILDNFDFNKMLKIMTIIGHRWHRHKLLEGSYYYPTIWQLKNCAKKLFEDLFNDKEFGNGRTRYISTGGFWAYLRKGKDNSVELDLQYVAVEYNNFVN